MAFAQLMLVTPLEDGTGKLAAQGSGNSSPLLSGSGIHAVRRFIDEMTEIFGMPSLLRGQIKTLSED